MQRDYFCCQYPQCDGENSMLEVHHKAYLSNTDPWDYPDYCFVTYCQDHHQIEQRRMEAAHMAIASNPALLGYCIGNSLENPVVNPVRAISKPESKCPSAEDGANFFKLMRERIK